MVIFFGDLELLNMKVNSLVEIGFGQMDFINLIGDLEVNGGLGDVNVIGVKVKKFKIVIDLGDIELISGIVIDLVVLIISFGDIDVSIKGKV